MAREIDPRLLIQAQAIYFDSKDVVASIAGLLSDLARLKRQRDGLVVIARRIVKATASGQGLALSPSLSFAIGEARALLASIEAEEKAPIVIQDDAEEFGP